MADTRGIRELAKEALHNSCVHCLGYPKCDGELPGEPHTAECPAKDKKPPKPVDIMAAFAESIVEQEQDAVIELIEAFVNDCNDGKWQPKKLIESIRSRWQRGEQQG